MEKPKYPSDEAAKFMLRLPGDMRDRIAETAEKNNRSMNAEIVARLTASFAPPRIGEKSEFLAGTLILWMSRLLAGFVDPEAFPTLEDERVQVWLRLAVAVAGGEREPIREALAALLGEDHEAGVDMLVGLVLAERAAFALQKILAERGIELPHNVF